SPRVSPEGGGDGSTWPRSPPSRAAWGPPPATAAAPWSCGPSARTTPWARPWPAVSSQVTGRCAASRTSRSRRGGWPCGCPSARLTATRPAGSAAVTRTSKTNELRTAREIILAGEGRAPLALLHRPRCAQSRDLDRSGALGTAGHPAGICAADQHDQQHRHGLDVGGGLVGAGKKCLGS